MSQDDIETVRQFIDWDETVSIPAWNKAHQALDRLVAERARFEFTDTINADLTEQVRLLHGRITELVAERDRLIQWTTDAASALHAARVIGEREGTHLNYANIDRLLEALTKTTEEQG